jgi:hypothetical protein
MLKQLIQSRTDVNAKRLAAAAKAGADAIAAAIQL